MNRVNEYLDSIFRDAYNRNPQIKELKKEMKTHLLETINELRLEGKTEEEATAISIERFGEPSIMTKDIIGRSRTRIHITKWLFGVAMSCLVAGLLVGTGVFLKGQQYDKTWLHVGQLIEQQAGKTELTEQDELELRETLERDPRYSRVTYFRLDKHEEVDAGTVSNSEPVPTFVSEPVFFYGQEEWGLMSGSGNQEWGAQWQMRGYESYLKKILIVPFLFMALATLSLIAWMVMDAAERKRVFY